MTKLIPILSGRCLVVELPEGAINPHIHPNSNGFWYKYEGDKGGFSYKLCDLPPGNWRIIGMLSEVREEQAAGIVDDASFKYPYLFKRKFEDYSCEAENDHDTAIESLESAIVAAGWYLENPYGLEPKRHIEAGMSKRGSWIMGDNPAWGKWQSAQSRVLCRERCLLLGREG